MTIKSKDTTGPYAGFYNCLCDGGHWLLNHDNVKVLAKGKAGQMSSPHPVEYFDTELEMEERIVQLGLIDDYPVEGDQ